MVARKCPECEGLVASTINVCPHCGYRFSVEAYCVSNQPAINYSENPNVSLAYVVCAFILFWPFAVVSLLYYIKSNSRWRVGDEAGAKYYGSISILWARIALWLNIACLLVLIFVLALL